MILQNKKRLFLTSLLTLLPMVVGLLIWDRLPFISEGWNPSIFAVFSPPLIMLAVHWICILVAFLDKSNDDRNRKVQGLVLWISPILSWMVSSITYALLLGHEPDVEQIMLVFMGLLFLVLGNYLPKCRMNSTIGIKIKWTYTSEENWNATHRMGGRIWMIGGAVIVLCTFLPGIWGIVVLLATFLVLIIAPVTYSYLFYRKEKASGKALLPYYNTVDPRITKVSLILVTLILIFVGFTMFTGDIQVRYGQESFTIEASYHDDLTVRYDAIENMEYREENIPGTRIMGFNSARLLMGYFENEEFGSYTRYTYTNPGSGIVIYCGNRVLVLSGENAAETQAIYRQLLEYTGK